MPRKAHRARRAAKEPVSNLVPRASEQPRRRVLVLGVVLLALGALFLAQQVRRAGPSKLSRPPEPLTLAPLSPARSSTSATQFVKLPPAETGLDFANPVDLDHPLAFLHYFGMAAGGLAVGDYDGDGLPDIYAVSGPRKNRLFRNLGGWRFEDVTARAGVDGGDDWGTGVASVDINADGWLDYYVCNYDAPNLLYVNQGNGTFRDEAARYGLSLTDASQQANFFDYDRDGDLDLFLLTYRYERPAGQPALPPIELVEGEPRIKPEFERYYKLSRDPPGYEPTGRSDGLLRNNGDGTFTDVSTAAGITGRDHGLSAVWWDYDNDGWPDLYVGNDFRDPDQLYRNNGDGALTDRIADVLPHTTWFSMGADAGDLNNDGLIDFLSTDMAGTTHYVQKVLMGAMSDSRDFLDHAEPRQAMRNAVLLNTGTGRFFEAAYLTNLAKTDWTWSARLGDLDCDGRLDAFFTNGVARSFAHSDLAPKLASLVGRTFWDFYKDTPRVPQRNLAFRNAGELKFDDVGAAWGLDHLGVSSSSVLADLDGDGDLDLLTADLEEPLGVYRNDSAAGHRALVKLEGAGQNRSGVGAVVRVRTAAGEQVRQLQPNSGFLSSADRTLHFGLGDAPRIEQLSVEWPSGRSQAFSDLAADQQITIVEPDAAQPAPSPPASSKETPPKGWFQSSSALASAAHREPPFDDFARQPLLPNRLSQLGPGLAWGDADGDGDDDLYLGAAAGAERRIWFNEGGGKFTPGDPAAFAADNACEDMAALWLDVDGDADQDLFVVSGGVECELGDAALVDRLYLNDGRGRLARSSDRLPDLRDSGSAAVAADFDRDGDLDLFVGSRSIPGQYPLTPDSRLLRNDAGRFLDISDEAAPGLRTTGLVTAALWTDADGDGWLDLLVAHEWGPLKLFRNEQGRLVERTREAGLAEFTGWWNGLAAADFDGDGDLDYVATNFGLNTKYHASRERPALLYYGDLDRSGKLNLVEAEFEHDKLFPVRGKSCSTEAMPSLAKKFPTFDAFAKSTLSEIYTPECLERVNKLSATTLESCVLVNDGQGRFAVRPLPRLAQIAPAFGVVASDFDGDGRPDLALAQNFYTPQRETGRMDGGLSLVLRGLGDATFEPLWPRASGVLVTGDAKALTQADLNGDGRLDLLVSRNDAPVAAFELGAPQRGRVITVRLVGPAGNPTGVGARVSLYSARGRRQTAEVTAGGSYLSQSAAALAFGLEAGDAIARISVRWPDGEEEDHPPQIGADGAILLMHSSRSAAVQP